MTFPLLDGAPDATGLLIALVVGIAFGWTLERCFGADFSIERMTACVGPTVAVGAVRASMGLANNTRDIERLLALMESFRNTRATRLSA